MRVSIAILSLLFAGTGILFAQQSTPCAPDEIFYNGKVITVDAGFSIQQAFAIRGDRFTAVGTNLAVRALAGPKTRLIDLGGHAVIPGLMDNHNHQYRAAMMMFRGVNMSGVGSVPELLQRIQRAVASAAPGQVIFTSSGWNFNDFPAKRPPTRQELDRVAAGHPIMVFRTRSEAYANTAALKALGISRSTDSFAGHPVPKDPSGEPTGKLTGRADALLNATTGLIPPPKEKEQEQLILRMQRRENALGLTSIRELQLEPDTMRAYYELWRQRKLTLRVSMGVGGDSDKPERLEARLKSWGVGPGFGDHWLRIDGVAELAVDSTIGNAYLRMPFAHPGGNYYGVLQTPREKLRQTLAVVSKYGWRPSIHIYGDKTLDVVLDAYEAANRVNPIRGQRWVVEHIPLVHPDQMDRMARLGVLVSAQAQPYTSGKEMLWAWGRERANRAVPMRQMLDHHLSVSGGSDWPSHPANPFINLYFYVTRNTADAGPLGVSQKISLPEALRVLTVNNAYLTFEEKSKGSIEPNELADFLILSQDILTVPAKQIRDIHPLATYVGGQKVFSVGGSGF